MIVTPAAAQTEPIPSLPGNAVPLEGDHAIAHGEIVEVEGGHGGFPPFNSQYYPSQLLWLAITFGLFYYVLKKTILPGIGAIQAVRRDRIGADLEAAERMRADADAAQAAYEQELATARDRSHKIATEARDVARRDADAERKRVEADLDAKLDVAQARIADIKTRALSEVDGIAEEAAGAILDELTGLQVSREDIARAVRAAR